LDVLNGISEKVGPTKELTSEEKERRRLNKG
jgi:hypothetical protein